MIMPKIKVAHKPRELALGPAEEPHWGTWPIMMSWFPPRCEPRVETKLSGLNW